MVLLDLKGLLSYLDGRGRANGREIVLLWTKTLLEQLTDAKLRLIKWDVDQISKIVNKMINWQNFGLEVIDKMASNLTNTTNNCQLTIDNWQLTTDKQVTKITDTITNKIIEKCC